MFIRIQLFYVVCLSKRWMRLRVLGKPNQSASCLRTHPCRDVARRIRRVETKEIAGRPHDVTALIVNSFEYWFRGSNVAYRPDELSFIG